jgi:hypothetical protein
MAGEELINAKFGSQPQARATVEVHLRTEQAFNAIQDAVVDALWDTFRSVILPEARSLTPVGTDPIEPGSTRNRESLDVIAWLSKSGPRAKLFSQSGHGGFVEVGTINMTGQPYAWPAMQMNMSRLLMSMKEHIALINTTEDVGLSRVIPE